MDLGDDGTPSPVDRGCKFLYMDPEVHDIAVLSHENDRVLSQHEPESMKVFDWGKAWFTHRPQPAQIVSEDTALDLKTYKHALDLNPWTNLDTDENDEDVVKLRSEASEI